MVAEDLCCKAVVSLSFRIFCCFLRWQKRRKQNEVYIRKENLLTCGGTSRTISSRIIVSHTKQLRYRKGLAVRTWVSENSCLKNCCEFITEENVGGKKKCRQHLRPRKRRMLKALSCTCKICVLPTAGAPRKTTFSGPCCHDVSFSPDPSRVNRYAEWCATHFFCIKNSISMEIRLAHFWFTFDALSTNFMLLG